MLAFSLLGCQIQAQTENSQNDTLEKPFFSGLESLPPSRTMPALMRGLYVREPHFKASQLSTVYKNVTQALL